MRGLARFGEVAARVAVVVSCAQIRTNVKRVFNSANGEGNCTATMGKGNAKLRKSREDATEHHRTDGERRFRGHSDEPWQPILRHSLFAHHVPWMNENCGAELFGCAPN